MSLHIETCGNGSPVLLIHGWGMHGGMWGVVAEKLAEQFCVHVVDLPGHGRSLTPSPAGGTNPNPPRSPLVRGEGKLPSPAGGESEARGAKPVGGEGSDEPAISLTLSRLREMGLDLLDSIADELSARFTGPLAVCGWSLGGQIALRWAMRQPQQVSRLVLVASTPCFVQQSDWPCAMAAETLAEFDAALRQNHAQTLRRFLALQVRGSEQERELLATLRSMLFSRGEPDLNALQGGLDILRDCDLRSALPGIEQAVLVIAGERDTLTPLSAAQYLASRLPNARLARIKGAAHAPFLSHPDEFLEYVVNFLSKK